MRRGDPHQSVADSLQADVMRFMAIIAFCLIAILALVRSVAPAAVPAPGPAASPDHEVGGVAAVPRVPRLPETVAAPVDREGAEPEPVEPEAVASKSNVPVEPDPAPGAPGNRPVAGAQVEPPRTTVARRSAPAEASEPAPPVETTATPQPQPPEDEGLSLRFASERDFLRLVTRGRIQVFAFNGREVLSIGADLKARPASAPGEVHELLPETIPDLMTGALARRGGEGYRWAVAMPDVMARQIRRFVDQGVTGELVIDRFGEVRHRDA